MENLRRAPVLVSRPPHRHVKFPRREDLIALPFRKIPDRLVELVEALLLRDGNHGRTVAGPRAYVPPRFSLPTQPTATLSTGSASDVVWLALTLS